MISVWRIRSTRSEGFYGFEGLEVEGSRVEGLRFELPVK